MKSRITLQAEPRMVTQAGPEPNPERPLPIVVCTRCGAAARVDTATLLGTGGRLMFWNDKWVHIHVIQPGQNEGRTAHIQHPCLLVRHVTYTGEPAVLVCDGRCQLAWGVSQRPKIQLSDNPDDVEFLGDGEAGLAPETPGTWEGGETKPINWVMNKWCARECERSELCRVDEAIAAKDWSERRRNLPQE